jgi:hypothetical protein
MIRTSDSFEIPIAVAFYLASRVHPQQIQYAILPEPLHSTYVDPPLLPHAPGTLDNCVEYRIHKTISKGSIVTERFNRCEYLTIIYETTIDDLGSRIRVSSQSMSNVV